MRTLPSIIIALSLIFYSCGLFSKRGKGIKEIVTKTKFSFNSDTSIAKETIDCDTSGRVLAVRNFKKNGKWSDFKYSYEKNIIHQGKTIDWILNNAGRAEKMLDKTNSDTTIQYNLGYYQNHLLQLDCYNTKTFEKYYTLKFEYENDNLAKIDRTDKEGKITVCQFSYYQTQNMPHDYIPYLSYIGVGTGMFYGPWCNMSTRDFVFPPNFLGTQSKNLIKSIVVNRVSEEIYRFNYDLNAAGKIKRIIVTGDTKIRKGSYYSETDITYNNDDENLIAHDNASKSPEGKVMTLREIKLALLDARIEKADLLLGKPDKKGRILSDLGGDTYYMVYFDKVLDNGSIKHLFLTIYTQNGISDNCLINTVDALDNFQSKYVDHGVSIIISGDDIRCNGRAFTIGNGDKNW